MFLLIFYRKRYLMGGFSFLLQLYRGELENGTQVAIRCLPLSKKYSIRNFKLRMDLLAKLRHPHLLALLGYCIDSVVGEDNVFLVYEYVPNGSFQTYLSGERLLILPLAMTNSEQLYLSSLRNSHQKIHGLIKELGPSNFGLHQFKSKC